MCRFGQLVALARLFRRRQRFVLGGNDLFAGLSTFRANHVVDTGTRGRLARLEGFRHCNFSFIVEMCSLALGAIAPIDWHYLLMRQSIRRSDIEGGCPQIGAFGALRMHTEVDRLMQQSGPQPAGLTREEFDEAVEALPEVGWRRLRKVATYFARGRPIDADDLLQEAFLRAMDDRRHCPRVVDIVRFLAGVMQSIASDRMKQVGRHPELRAMSLFGKDGQQVIDLVDDGLTPEAQAADAQECARITVAIRGLFSDDPVYEVIVDGIMEGLEGQELLALTDLDATGFNSARRLIRRRIDTAFPKGTRP